MRCTQEDSMGRNLILISCSDHKKHGGYPIYNKNNSILSIFQKDDPLLKKILNVRYQIFKKIKEGKTFDSFRSGGYRKDSSYNKELNIGPDLSLNLYNNYLEGSRTETLYLEAYQRYCGRFFSAAEELSFILAEEMECHTLLVSGLYGLITLQEPIQLYTSYLGDDIIPDENKDDSELLCKIVKAKVLDLWRVGNENLMNSCLLKYIEHHNNVYGRNHKIENVIDLLSEYTYQVVFDWDELHKRFRDKSLKITPMHRVVTGMKEPEFLPDLGRFYKNFILEESQCNEPKLNEDIIKEYFSSIKKLTFKNKIEFDPYIKDIIIAKISKDLWNILDRSVQSELIQAETFYDLAFARARDKKGKADRNMHYFTAIEGALYQKYGPINVKRNNKIVKSYGSIGEYLFNFKHGDLKKQANPPLIQDLEKLNSLRKAHLYHFKDKTKHLTWDELDIVRNLILSKEGLLWKIFRDNIT